MIVSLLCFQMRSRFLCVWRIVLLCSLWRWIVCIWLIILLISRTRLNWPVNERIDVIRWKTSKNLRNNCITYGCIGFGCIGYGCIGYGCIGYGCIGGRKASANRPLIVRRIPSTAPTSPDAGNIWAVNCGYGYWSGAKYCGWLALTGGWNCAYCGGAIDGDGHPPPKYPFGCPGNPPIIPFANRPIPPIILLIAGPKNGIGRDSSEEIFNVNMTRRQFFMVNANIMNVIHTLFVLWRFVGNFSIKRLKERWLTKSSSSKFCFCFSFHWSVIRSMENVVKIRCEFLIRIYKSHLDTTTEAHWSLIKVKIRNNLYHAMDCWDVNILRIFRFELNKNKFILGAKHSV